MPRAPLDANLARSFSRSASGVDLLPDEALPTGLPKIDVENSL